MSDIAIKVENLSKKYHLGTAASGNLRDTLAMGWNRLRGKASAADKKEFWALQDVSFEVKKGEVIGVIGRNGAGKSTLLKILSRITEPTSGRVTLNGRVASLLEVGTGFHPELSGRENIYLNGALLGMTRAEIKRKFDEIIDFSGVEEFIDTSVKKYSSGMYVRLAFAVAAHLEPEILLVDEVLAVGDAEFQKKCLGKMDEVAKGGRTVVFVSHDMGAVRQLCPKGLLFDNGILKNQANIDIVINRYLQKNHNLKNEKSYSKDSIIKFIKVEQIESKIILTARYQTNNKLYVPSLGFVIYNHLEAPITAFNPTLSPNTDFNTSYPQQGTVKAIISQPHLLDGEYTLSVWFGNGYEDFFEDKNCLKLDICGMTLNKQMEKSIVGSVSPTCHFEYF